MGNCTNGVVSLLAMLEFQTRGYIELAYSIGVLAGLSAQVGDVRLGADLGSNISKLLSEALRLGLPITRDYLNEMLKESISSGAFTIVGALPNATIHVDYQVENKESLARLSHKLESLYTVVRSELDSILFRAIPKERSEFTNPEWLRHFGIDNSFPTSFLELNRSGMCYALGQSTASVFHSMRALEPGLAALAAHFGISAAYDNWQNIIESIEKSVRAIGQQAKSSQKTDEETFFGNATSHLYFVKNAWRNHVMHARGSYEDFEAKEILSRTAGFVNSLIPRLREP